jgi:hypothetical protein
LVSGAAFSEVSAAARRVERTELSFDDERGDTLALPTMMVMTTMTGVGE